jgi:predicted ATP-grasp superfamily ATP-dependent carboligase
LAQAGLEVHVAEWLPWACALLSRSCSRKLISPNPQKAPQAYLEFILKQLQQEKYDCLLAMEEDTLLLLSSIRTQLEKYTSFPFPEEALIRKVRDKANLAPLAQAVNVSYPQSAVLESFKDLKSYARDWGYPLVVKPCITSGSRGMTYIYKEGELQTVYDRVARNLKPVLVQQYIAGNSYGVSCLMGAGQEFLGSFVHMRLRAFPVQGGPSTLAVSAVYPQLQEAACELLSALKWYGVAMVEFKVTPEGRFYLIEINPRFWGSLALAIHCGVNFPYLLYQLAMGQDFKPVHTYPEGEKLRWFFPGDLLHFIYNPQRLKIAAEFLDFRIKDGIFCLQDPLPLAGKMLSALYLLTQKDYRQNLKIR